jgi:nucleoside-diphosphate-sugar epimerase
MDITNKNDIQQCIENINPNIVIHLAAVSRVEDANNDRKKCITTNYLATKYIVEEVAKHQNMLLIFASSREVYGEPEQLPVKETDELLPCNIYGCYKLRSEEYIRRNLRKYIILRFSNVYGNTYDRCERVIPKFVHAAISGGTITLEGGEQIIDFTYIDDTVQAIIQAMKKLFSGEITKDTIHILPGRDNSIKDIISILEKLGYSPTVETNEPRDYDVQKFYGDPTHMQESLGLDPAKFTSLENGIKQYINRIHNEERNTQK